MLPMVFCWVLTVQMQDREIIFLGPKLFAAEQVYVAIYRIKFCHTAHETLTVLQGSFPGRVISCFVNQSWPPGSCDLTSTNFFCGVFLSFRLLHTCIGMVFVNKFSLFDTIRFFYSHFAFRVVHND